jgi:hypothetical protein
MITHYDMATGEMIDSENDETPGSTASVTGETAALQLISVQEELRLQTVGRQHPCVAAMLPITVLLGSAD